MTQFEGFLRRRHRGRQVMPYLRGRVFAADSGIDLEQDFLIDTGSERTVLNVSRIAAAERIALRAADLGRADSGGLEAAGGTALQAWTLRGATLYGETPTHDWVDITPPSVLGIDADPRHPHVIGCDLMDAHGFILRLDFAAQRVDIGNED